MASPGRTWRPRDGCGDVHRDVEGLATSLEGRQRPQRVGSVLRGSALSLEGRHCRQGCQNVNRAVWISTGLSRSLQGRSDAIRIGQYKVR